MSICIPTYLNDEAMMIARPKNKSFKQKLYPIIYRSLDRCFEVKHKLTKIILLCQKICKKGAHTYIFLCIECTELKPRPCKNAEKGHYLAISGHVVFQKWGDGSSLYLPRLLLD